MNGAQGVLGMGGKDANPFRESTVPAFTRARKRPRRCQKFWAPPIIPTDALRAYELPLILGSGDVLARSKADATDIAWALDSIERALKHVYEAQNDKHLRWASDEKVRDMNDEEQRFLFAEAPVVVAVDRQNAESTDDQDAEREKELKNRDGDATSSLQRLGFVSYRVDKVDEVDEDSSKCVQFAVYVYEVYVVKAARGKGLAKALLRLLELVCACAGVDLIVLTVFKTNIAAMSLYTKTLAYSIDETSPEKCGYENISYSILSKRLSARSVL
jgi:ribosomal protein S18 acetylase RimI-like enzyme